MAFERLLHELQRCCFIASARDVTFQDLAFVIDRTSEIDDRRVLERMISDFFDNLEKWNGS